MLAKTKETEDIDDLSAAVLWVHVLSGAVWIGACACLVIALSAMAAGSGEFRDFVNRAMPLLNRVSVAAGLALVISGAARFLMLKAAGGFAPSAMFIDVLLAKIALFAAMTIAMAASLRASAMLRAEIDSRADSAGATTRRIAVLSGLIAGLGGAAMLLGLWLVGS